MKNHFPFPVSGQCRAVVERVTPEIDSGRYAIKSIINDILTVEADIIIDGHDKLAARLLFRHESEKNWSEVVMLLAENDRWVGHFTVEKKDIIIIQWKHGLIMLLVGNMKSMRK